MHTQFPYRKVHFVGIKGAGMSALAQILHSHNISVTGSDTKEVFFSDISLRRAGIHFFERFSKDNIPADIEAIVYSTAYQIETNEELLYAQSKGIVLFSYPEFLGILTKQKLSIAVAGTHGKTTVTAMLAHTLLSAKKDPSAVVGSTVLNWKGGSLSGTGPHFVFEADEYQNKFRFYTPWSLIVTNIGYDHSDFFPNQESYNETFSTFIKRIPPHGWIVVCADNIQALTVSEKAVSHRITYGFHKDSMYCIEEMPCKKGFSQTFCVKKGENELGVFSLQISGKHNIQNATAVIAFCDTIGMSIQDIFFGLSDFKGTARRMEYIGEYNKAIVLDDYAHHPEEIEATLQAVNQKYPQKEKIVVFQPHTFSRTKEFLDGFAQSLSKADAVLLLDVYSSAREVSGEISSNDIVSLINKYYPEKSSNVHTIENAVSLLRKSLDKKTLVITMGAGDVWQVGKELLKK